MHIDQRVEAQRVMEATGEDGVSHLLLRTSDDSIVHVGYANRAGGDGGRCLPRVQRVDGSAEGGHSTGHRDRDVLSVAPALVVTGEPTAAASLGTAAGTPGAL